MRYEIVVSRKTEDIPVVDDKVLIDLVAFTLSEDKVQELREKFNTFKSSGIG